jgi:hypothetical protein
MSKEDDQTQDVERESQKAVSVQTATFGKQLLN